MKLIGLLLSLAVRARTYDATTAEEREHPCGNEISSAPGHSSIPTGQRRGRNLRFGYTSGPQLIKKLEHAKLSHSGYGNSVSISEQHVAVGAKSVGVVYVYDASDGTEIGNQLWQTGTDQFGHAVATSGGVLVVGAPDAGNNGEGKAYVYDDLSEAGILANTPKLVLECSDCFFGDKFGWSVATDGVYAVVGAPGMDGDAGKAYLFDVWSCV